MDTVIKEASKFGFVASETGGGCTALHLDVTRPGCDISMMITDDADIPETLSGSSTFGMYCWGFECIFLTNIHTISALRMGQKIKAAINAFHEDGLLTPEIAEVRYWLIENNLNPGDAWEDIQASMIISGDVVG